MLCQSTEGGLGASYSEVVCPCSHSSHCCETWFALANFFLLGPALPQFFLLTKAVTVLFIWKNALFTFLILQRLSASICHSVSFMHWLQIGLVLCLNCTLSSSPSRRACCSYTFCIIGKRLFHNLGCHPLWSIFFFNSLKVHLTFLNSA